MKLRFTLAYGAALAGGLGMSAPAAAEVLPVAGIYPARVDDAAAIHTIAIENFSGDKGVALSFAITDRLENVVIEGAPYFQLVPTSDASVDAVMRGSAGTEALETNPDNISVLFNIGLCAEGKGDLDAAEHYYQRVLELEPGKDYPTSGLQRIADRDRAEAQLNIHFNEVEAAADAPTE